MIINSRSSNFVFNFPKGFFSDYIEEKYKPYVMRMPLPWDTIHNYMNAQIQSVTMPSLTMPTVSQVRKGGKDQKYKSGQPVPDYLSKEMTVTMRALDGYINYWIFMDNALRWLDLDEPALYHDDLYMRIMDQEGHIIQSVRFEKPILTGISQVTASFSDNNPEVSTFDCTFEYNAVDFVVERD